MAASVELHYYFATFLVKEISEKDYELKKVGLAVQYVFKETKLGFVVEQGILNKQTISWSDPMRLYESIISLTALLMLS